MSLTEQTAAFALAIAAGAAGASAAGLDGTLAAKGLAGVGMYAVFVNAFVALIATTAFVGVRALCGTTSASSVDDTTNEQLSCCVRP